MLDIESFDPPAEFTERALLSDPSVYETAEADWKGWWTEQAKTLHWFKEPTTDVDESDPPFYKWFADGTINASYNCLDRHVEAGNGDRVAYHWHGEEGETKSVTYAELHADVQKLANALKDLGIEKGDIVGIYLPMIPEVAVAMLACARIGAPHNVVFGGFSADSVKERMEFSEAKALITVDGARRKGKTAPIKSAVDAVMGDLDTLEHIVVVQVDRRRLRDAGGARRLVPRDLRSGRSRVPGRAAGRRASAVRALHERFDGQAQGCSAHDRRLPDRRQHHPPARVRPQGRSGRVLVRRRRRLDHRALLHRLRTAGQRRHLGDVGGRAGLSPQGHLVGAGREVQGQHPVLRADRDPGVHEVGNRAHRQVRPQFAAAARARSASRSTPRRGSGTTR